MAAKTKGPVTHSPDAPFGCVATWGEPIQAWGNEAWGNDVKLHVCNLPNGHDTGPHICKCGEHTALDMPIRDEC